MGIVSWLTGRDEKEADVYANFEKVDVVVSGIKKISSNEVENARDSVNEAINQLNNVNGLAQYVGNINTSAFNGIFESIASTIVKIGEQVQAKADDIKAYESSSWWEKAGSTVSMAFAKTGEGVLSVFEDLGDGVVSLVGWAAPKDSGVEKWCSDFVEKEWAHDTFNFYYESDFAKKSTFTEDSGIAGAFKITGSIAGTLAISAATAGVASGAGLAAKGGAAKAANILIGNTTRANTTMAALMGMGSGTEAGLKQGLSFNEAALAGAKQGVVQGGIAYGFGKLGEHNAAKPYKEQIKQGEALKTKAQETMKQAGKDMKNPELTRGMIDKAQNTFSQAQDDIIRADKLIAEGKKGLTGVQGYNDAISKTAYKYGEKFGRKASEEGIKSAVKATATVAGGKVVGGVKTVGNTVRHPVNSAKEAFKSGTNAAKNAATSGKDAIKNAGTNLKDKATGVKDNVKNTLTGEHKIANIAKGTGKAIGKKGAVSSAVVPGVTAATINSISRNNTKSASNAAATAQFNSKPKIDQTIGDTTNLNPNVNYNATLTPNIENSTPTPTAPESTPKSTNGGRSSGGGSSYRATTGRTTSSSTPTATSPTSNTNTGDSTQQFKKEKIKAEVTEKKPVETRTNIDVTPNPTPTPNPEPNPTPTPKPEPDKVITPPSDNTNNTTTTVTPPPTNTNTGGQNNQYTGGGYSGSGGYQGYTEGNNDFDFTTDGADDFSDIDDMLTDSTTSIDDVIKGSKYTKIPTSSKPITSASSGGGGSAVIPVVAGLSAAAAAGVGAKVYMDRKNNNFNGEDEIETEEWSGEDTLNLDYDDSSDTESYLDEDDDYGYQTEEQTERYDARNNEELADLQ